jgi:carbonic anhydrase
MAEIPELVEGFRRFRRRYFSGERHLYRRLSEGQTPTTLVVACSDSRVDPAIVLDADPGDLFVVRNVANLVPPYESDGGRHGVSAALEFGVRTLGAKDVVVMGHAKCGGIRALHEGTQGEFVPQWMSIAASARAEMLLASARLEPEQRERELEFASMRLSLRNLAGFPWIRSAVESGSLALHAWYFDLERGELLRVPADGAPPEPLCTGDEALA